MFIRYKKDRFLELLAVEAQTMPGSTGTTEGGKGLTDSNFNLEGVLHWIPKENTHSQASFTRSFKKLVKSPDF